MTKLGGDDRGYTVRWQKKFWCSQITK